MKTIIILVALLSYGNARAQEERLSRTTFPIKITIFSESIGMPSFKNLFRGPGIGIRIGTEFYYKQVPSGQLLQTVNLGYYSHKKLHNGLYLSSEFGYRKFFEHAFADATIGLGYLLVKSALPRYEFKGSQYVKSASTFGRVMPTLGLGAGYQFKTITFFGQYEVFGEMPFGFRGLPALPHKSLHLGTRLKFN